MSDADYAVVSALLAATAAMAERRYVAASRLIREAAALADAIVDAKKEPA